MISTFLDSSTDDDFGFKAILRLLLGPEKLCRQKKNVSRTTSCTSLKSVSLSTKVHSTVDLSGPTVDSRPRMESPKGHQVEKFKRNNHVVLTKTESPFMKIDSNDLVLHLLV